MNKQNLLKIINPVLFLVFLFQIITAVFLKYSEIEVFSGIHQINGLILVGLALVHLILNFQWIKSLFIKKKN